MPDLIMKNPFQLFTDTNGIRLQDGQIFIGEPHIDPETNPITVYWDDAYTQTAVQPIVTNGGYPVNEFGIVGNIYINQNYSITVRDTVGELVFFRSTLSAGELA